MRDPERIDRIASALRDFWRRHPDMRLGQIVFAAARAGGMQGDDAFDVEDGVVEQGLVRLAGGGQDAP